MSILQDGFVHVPQNERKAVLNRFNPFADYELTDRRFCHLCEQNITVGDYKLERIDGLYYICCPNAPKCNGTIIHWFAERKERKKRVIK
jgi:hypothetical protein